MSPPSLCASHGSKPMVTGFTTAFSRVVEGRFIFQISGHGSAEAERFTKLMRCLEAFSGVRVLTYVLMSNHGRVLRKSFTIRLIWSWDPISVMHQSCNLTQAKIWDQLVPYHDATHAWPCIADRTRRPSSARSSAAQAQPQKTRLVQQCMEGWNLKGWLRTGSGKKCYPLTLLTVTRLVCHLFFPAQIGCPRDHRSFLSGKSL